MLGKRLAAHIDGEQHVSDPFRYSDADIVVANVVWLRMIPWRAPVMLCDLP